MYTRDDMKFAYRLGEGKCYENDEEFIQDYESELELNSHRRQQNKMIQNQLSKLKEEFSQFDEKESFTRFAVLQIIEKYENATEMKTGVSLIAIERQRQIEVKGFSSEHDLKYTEQELAKAASCYVTPTEMRIMDNLGDGTPANWPWKCCWNPTPENRVQELVKAGALIAAEIDRLQNIK